MQLSAQEIKALLTGLAIDFGGSIALGVLLAVVYGSSLAMDGLNEVEVTEALKNIPVDSWVSLFGTMLGAALSALGGYVCARKANASDYRLGVIQALCSAFFSLMIGYDEYSGSVMVLLLGVTIAAVLFGTRMGIASLKT